MIDLAEFQRLKKEAEEAKTQASQAKGAFDSQMQKLQSEFGVNSIEEAEKLELEMQTTVQNLENEFNQALTEYKATLVESK